MSQIKTKFILDNAITDPKFRARNNQYIRGRNAADNGDVNILKVNGSDVIEFASFPQKSGTPANNDDLVNKSYVDSGLGNYVPLSQKGAANGVATLDANGKLPSSQLTVSAFEYLGTWSAATNTPTLANGVGNNGDVYHVSAAGSVDFGAGAIAFSIGDKVAYNGSVWEKWDLSESVASVNGQTGVVVLDTDDIAEGSSNLYYTNARFDARLATKSTSDLAEGSNLYYTDARFDSRLATKSTSDLAEGSNLYFTDARARTAVITQVITNGVTDRAPSEDAVFDALALKANAADIKISKKESITLVGGDITNQYVDLLFEAEADSVNLSIDGVMQYEGVDYTLSVVASKTRITFAGDLATGGSAELIAGDVLRVQYRK